MRRSRASASSCRRPRLGLRPRTVSRHLSKDLRGREPHAVALAVGDRLVVRVAAPVDGAAPSRRGTTCTYWPSGSGERPARRRRGPPAPPAPGRASASRSVRADVLASGPSAQATSARRRSLGRQRCRGTRRSALQAHHHARRRRSSVEQLGVGRAGCRPAGGRSSSAAAVSQASVERARSARSVLAPSSARSHQPQRQASGRGTPPRPGRRGWAVRAGVVVAGDQAPQLAVAQQRDRHRGAHAHVLQVLEVDRGDAAQRGEGEVQRRPGGRVARPGRSGTGA